MLLRLVAIVTLLVGLGVLGLDAVRNRATLESAIVARAWPTGVMLVPIAAVATDVIEAMGAQGIVPPTMLESMQSHLPQRGARHQGVLAWPAGPVLSGVGLLLLVLSRKLRRRRTAAPGPRRDSELSSAKAAEPTSAPVTPPRATQRMRGAVPQDREFLPAALEILESPPSPLKVAFLWFICLLFSAALTWSYFGKLDIHAVAQGRVQPSGRSKVVQPLEAGRVVAIHVENGSRVRAGDVVLELDPTETAAERQALRQDLTSIEAESVRRRAAVAAVHSGQPGQAAGSIQWPDPVGEALRQREAALLMAELANLASVKATLVAQRAEREAQRQRLTLSVASREKQLALLQERVDMRDSLFRTGSGSRAAVVDILNEFQKEQTVQTSEQGQILEVEAAMLSIEQRSGQLINEFVLDQTQKLVDLQRRHDRLSQELIKASSKNERTRLVAPIAGTVQQLAVTTIGQVVAGGQSLMTVVPQDAPIEVEALLLNQDIGFVEINQPTVVKIDAFPFMRYGAVTGTVARVWQDAVEERDASVAGDAAGSVRPQGARATPGRGQNLVFPVTIALNERAIRIEDKLVPLSPGMTVTVEIRTGERRVIDYVISPLGELLARSGRER